MTQRSPSRERGFALLIVLWSVVLLAFLATGITEAGRTDVELAANLRGAAQAEAAADGAVYAAAFHLLDPASPWQADGQTREVAAPGARVTLRIEDEAGKINPNTASPELLRALLHAAGADLQTADRLAKAVVEWRFPRARANGAPGGPLGATRVDAPAYRTAGLDYGPPGAPFESLDELGLVLGMTPAILARLTPHISILNDADPDPRRADAVVLQAIREALGPPPPPRGPPAPPRTVTVTAEALTPAGSRFSRRASVRLGRSEKERLLLVLSWEAG